MIELRDIWLSYGERTLFRNLTAVIGLKDRIGLVGSNGAGKSTLLKILMGMEQADKGAIQHAHYVTLGYLPQEGIVMTGKTVYAEVESACEDILSIEAKIKEAGNDLEKLPPEDDHYAETLELIGELEHRLEELEAHKLKAKIEKVLMGLGFAANELERPVETFSGGWQMRVALAKLLLREPSLLLLDEPTNHLDLDSLRWLETHLKQYDGAIMLVSHDRAFLDNLCNRTFALSMGKLETYTGNYSTFEKVSAQRKELQEKAFKNQQRQIEQTERFINRFRYKNTKARQVQSRIKSLEKLDRIEIENEESEIQFQFPPPPHCGHTVLKLEDIHKAYDSVQVFRGLDLEIENGDRIAIVGPNGAGKSTLTRILAGEETFQAGTRTIGHKVSISYFGQHQSAELKAGADVLSTAAQTASDESRPYVRNILGAFLFQGDDVFKDVSVLSGGEKNRLALAKMLLRPANCLILDEPTNHLDMRSKAILQNALWEYEGTYIVVSHDRDFLNQIVTKVVEVRKSGIRVFPGNIDDYIVKIEEEQRLNDERRSTSKERQADTSHPSSSILGISATQLDNLPTKERRRITARLREELAPLKKRSKELEAEIATLEDKTRQMEDDMADPAFFKQGEKTTRQMKEYDELKQKLADDYEEWETLTVQLEEKGGAIV